MQVNSVFFVVVVVVVVVVVAAAGVVSSTNILVSWKCSLTIIFVTSPRFARKAMAEYSELLAWLLSSETRVDVPPSCPTAPHKPAGFVHCYI